MRLELANRLAALGNRSDGWTAAGAAATLVELGAVKYGIDVVSKIPDSDPNVLRGRYLAVVACWRPAKPN